MPKHKCDGALIPVCFKLKNLSSSLIGYSILIVLQVMTLYMDTQTYRIHENIQHTHQNKPKQDALLWYYEDENQFYKCSRNEPRYEFHHDTVFRAKGFEY